MHIQKHSVLDNILMLLLEVDQGGKEKSLTDPVCLKNNELQLLFF